MKNKAVITGVGVVSAYGLSSDLFWRGLLGGVKADRALQFPEGLKMTKGYVLPDYDPADHFDRKDLPLLDLFSQYAILAAREAVRDSRLKQAELDRTAVIVGSGNGGKHTDEEGYLRLYKQGNPRVHPYMIPKGMHSAVASNVSFHMKAKGPTLAVSSACASGAHAVIHGIMMVELGIVDAAIVGGADAPFSYGILKAWDALRIITNDEIRPFCADRSGTILGDGAGILVIESEKHARNRGADIYGALSGYGMSSDSCHITNPDAQGIKQAIIAAHRSSGIPTSEISYINAHGTGTHANDITEAAAIREVYGDSYRKISVSTTKPLHGHALGAASSMEVIATALSIRDSVIPPIVNFTKADPECDLNLVIDVARKQDIEHAVSNSFAFGGLNAVLVLSRFH